jgi:hypothetical protein
MFILFQVQRISGEDELKGTKREYWETEARWQTPPATSTSAEGNCFVDADRLRDILQEQRHSCQFLFSEALTYQVSTATILFFQSIFPCMFGSSCYLVMSK